MIEQSPILGYGYSAGFARLLGPQIESIIHTQFSHAHNSYLEVLIAFGYVGMTICVAEFSWLLWGTARLLIRSPSQDAKLNAFPLSILIVLLGLNHIESLLINRTGITTLFFAILAGLIVRDQYRYSERRQLRLA
jgi:O-antigen ligase